MAGALIRRVEWYKESAPGVQVPGLSPMLDILSIRITRGLDIKNNLCSIQFKNPNARYVDPSGEIEFKEEDQLKVYAKLTDDAYDLENAWYTTSELLGEYYIEEYKIDSSEALHRITVDAVDKAYILFNKVMANSYGAVDSDKWTAPGIFRSVTRINSDTEDTTNGFLGTDNDGGYFSVDAKYVSEGGYIQDIRPDITATTNGVATSGDTTITVDSTSGFKTEGTLVVNGEHVYYSSTTPTTFEGCSRAIDDTIALGIPTSSTVYQGFPTIQVSKIWKPLFEWLGDLGQTTNTNYSEEQSEGSFLYYDRAFLLWVDERNRIHFLPADNNVDQDLVVSSDLIYSMSLEKSVFDSVNMIIYNSGTDMEGLGITWYHFDESSEVKGLKMRYQPMTEISQTLIDQDFKINTLRKLDEQDKYLQYPDDSLYPISSWGFKNPGNEWRKFNGDAPRITLTDDADYNEALREACYWIGRNEAKSIVSKFAGLRYKGSIALPGVYLNPGDLITVTDVYTGVKSQKLRVIDVNHSISGQEWSTTLDVEEDEKTIE